MASSMFGALGGALGVSGLADYYSDALRRQQQAGLGGLGQLDVYRQRGMDALMDRKSYKRKKNIKEELQDEVDEWLKDVL